MLLGPDGLRQAVDALALVLLASAVGIVLARRLDSLIALLTLQGALLTGVAVAVALADGTFHAYVAVALTLGVKAIAIPGLLAHALGEVRVRRESDLVLPQRLVLVGAFGLILVAYYVGDAAGAGEAFVSRNALPAAIALMLLGLLGMLTRRQALFQVAGLVATENGLYLAAIVATRGLPLAVELGVALDVMVGVAVMIFLSRRIYRQIGDLDTDQLGELRH